MSQKALKQLSKMPHLAQLYKDASKDLYGVHVSVRNPGNFIKLQSKLYKLGIFPRDYTYRLLECLEGWVKTKGWLCVPENVFCGDWAVNYFQEYIGNRQCLTPDSVVEHDALLLQEELTLARLYIHLGGMYNLDDVVKMLEPTFSDDWIKLYRNNRRTVLVAGALDVLFSETGVYANSYDAFV